MLDHIAGEGGLFDRFCRKEEYGSKMADQYGRFPYYASRDRDIFEPAVSRHLAGKGFEPEYEGGAKFALCLTHDVDALNCNGMIPHGAQFLRAVLTGDVHGAFSRYGAGTARGRFLEFDEIIELEKRYGARSTFYFLAVDRDSEDHAYDIADLSGELASILDSGFEIGLHGSQKAHADLASMSEERRRLEAALGRKVSGYRNHYLRFRTPLTWRLLEQAGFSYDTTLGYADCVGFRNGMCHPFRPYDLEAGGQTNIVELPLVIMDQTLFGDYMRLDPAGAWELTKGLIDKVEQCNGIMTVLWHNYLMHGEYLAFYEKILRYGRERRAWMTGAEELVRNALAQGL